MPHGHCYLWQPEIVWLNVISDVIITVSYYAIPIVLAYIVVKGRSRLPFNRTFLLFALFILACGTTHLMEIVNIWKSEYVLSGLIKAITAAVSILTAISLIPIIPKVIAVLREADEKTIS
jgi:hypothetical protein